MKNILVIDNSAGLTGALKVMLYVAEFLHKEYGFHFACAPGNAQINAFTVKKDIHFLPVKYLEISKSWRTVFYPPVLLVNAIKLAWYCKKMNISVVHVNDMYNMTGILLKAINPRIRLIYHVRLLSGSYVGRLYRVWLWLINKKADQVVAVSQAVFNETTRLISPGKLNLLYDYLPLPEISEHRHHSENVVRFLYPANFTPGKGHDLAILAFRMAVKKNPNIKITFVGDDFDIPKNIAYRKAMIDLAGDMVRTGFVQFLEPRKDIEHLYRTHDVVLNFSKSESFSMTCFEASFYGLPVIATRCGGPEEIICHQVTGYLVEYGNVAEMAERMTELAQNPEKRQIMGYQAKLHIRRQIAAHNAIQAYRNLYSDTPQ